MCTAISFKTKDHYFGRNLDIDRSYGEEVCIYPRKFPIVFKEEEALREHFAMIGMATVMSGEALFYDAVNEYGLCAAGLNFPENAHYASSAKSRYNIASFELIPWLLGQCRDVESAKRLLERTNITNLAFSEKLQPTPLHWMICDKHRALTVEMMRDGLHIYENAVGVLTNNPPFEHQLAELRKYSDLRTDNARAVRTKDMPYSAYSQGLGAIGLPGDVSSGSRFVRMAFEKRNSVCDETETASVGQVFHLLSSVEMIRGICKTDVGGLDVTLYSVCINSERGLYYYTTYKNRRISCIDMHKGYLDSSAISRFSLLSEENIHYQN